MRSPARLQPHSLAPISPSEDDGLQMMADRLAHPTPSGPADPEIFVASHRRLNAGAPAPLVERARKARLVGERKPVTAVFADIVGSTTLAEAMDPEEWTEIINGAFDSMSRSVFDLEGTIAQVQGDALISFFGAPVAHEDDPERAVRAALSMIEAIDDYGHQLRRERGIDFGIRIGISTGLVLVGQVGSDLRYDYSAVGDTMNLAARLQAQAPPGGILVSDRTERFIEPLFEMEDIGSLQLKGKTTTVRAYRVLGPRREPRSTRGISGLRSAMVGRDEELASLMEASAVVRAGRGRVALVVGEPGMGKSRLLRELRASLAEPDRISADVERGFAWVTARASSYGQRMPFHAVTNLVFDVLGVSPATRTEDVDDALRTLLGDRVESDDDLYRYLAYLLGIPLAPEVAGEIGRVNGDLLYERFAGAVIRLVRSIAEEGPMVLVLEDLHWFDAASIELLDAILVVIDDAAVLAVLTTRDEPTTAGWSLVTRARERFGRSLLEIRLGPLDHSSSAAMVADLLELESLPDGTRELILDKAEGNPYFVEEVIRMLIDRGVIERRDDRWVATRTTVEVEIPDTLHGLILARIDRLPEEARRILRLASCIDRRFSVPLLEDVARSAGNENRVGSSLSRLEGANLLTLAATDPELEYRFSHALVQDAANQTILRQERREWHHQIAEALLARYPDREPDMADRLARHFESADDVPRAVHYLTLAARRAMTRNAMSDAKSMFEHAHGLLSGMDEPEGVEASRLRVLTGLGRIATSFSFMLGEDILGLLAELRPDAERLAEGQDDAALLADVLYWEILTRRSRGEASEPGSELASAVERLEQLGDVAGDDDFRAQTLFQSGLMLWWMGDFLGSLSMLDEAVPLMRRSNDVIGSAMTEGYIAANHASLGNFEEADRRMAISRQLTEQADVLARLDFQLAEAGLAGQRGDFGTSVRYADECLGSAVELGALGCATVAGTVLGASQVGSGSAIQARISLQRALELAAQGFLVPVRMRANIFLSSAQALGGELDLARQGFSAVIADTARAGSPYGEAEAKLQRGLVLAGHPDGDPASALADLEDAGAVFGRLGARPAQARAMRGQAMALTRLGRVQEADAAFGEAASMAREMGLMDGPWPDSVEALDAAASAPASLEMIE